MSLILYLLAILVILYIFSFFIRKATLRKDMPMLLSFILNIHNFHDKISQLLIQRKGTFLFKGAWFGQQNMLFTADPADIRHIMSTNFSNYVKGSGWRKRVDIFGKKSIFNADLEDWRQQRIVVRGFFNHRDVQKHVDEIILDIIKNQLIPILNKVSDTNSIVDLKDLFARYAFDFACSIAFGSNPNSLLKAGQKQVPFLEALDHACEAIFMRYIFPEFVWKIQRSMDFGKERLLRKSWKAFDEFFKSHFSMENRGGLNALSYLEGNDLVEPSVQYLRDNIISLILAAQDTTSVALSWFFWLLSKNPLCENKIRQELEVHLPRNQHEKWVPEDGHDLDQMNKLVYLQAAIYESLRLFPPVPYETRTPVGAETLPSGHLVDENTTIWMCGYAMGRMESIWGQDCCEFKPERWITKDGRIQHEPSHKFFAFLSGPRICPGRDIGFTLMKAIIATVIHNYKVHVVDTRSATYSLSIVLKMESHLMANIKSI